VLARNEAFHKPLVSIVNPVVIEATIVRQFIANLRVGAQLCATNGVLGNEVLPD
jgi:hypothetical protein